MRIAIAGGHGQIALALARLLTERGDEVRSLIRNPDHAGDIEATGAEPVVCDLENAADEEVAAAVGDAEAVVFAAGAGPGSGPERKMTMDYGGAVKLITAAKAGRRRPLRDGRQHGRGRQRARRRHVRRLPARQGQGRRRPAGQRARLHDRPPRPAHQRPAGTGRVALTENGERGEIPREDVAAVLAAVLHAPNTIGKTLDLISGDVPVAEAVVERLRAAQARRRQRNG